MCLLLAPDLPRHFQLFFLFFFWLRPITVIKRQTRPAVHAIDQSILLRCLWMKIELIQSRKTVHYFQLSFVIEGATEKLSKFYSPGPIFTTFHFIHNL
jgi:hypothetical protein